VEQDEEEAHTLTGTKWEHDVTVDPLDNTRERNPCPDLVGNHKSSTQCDTVPTPQTSTKTQVHTDSDPLIGKEWGHEVTEGPPDKTSVRNKAQT
jgi:hypothetical protein